jgi:Zn-dependent protease with chaperone function
MLLIAVIAILPGLISWWVGRGLSRRLDDPTLPERLHSARVRRGAAVGVALVFLAVLSFRALVWSLPLMCAALLIAAYPLRRTLFAETWSLTSYAWFFVRLNMAVWGFWALLAMLVTLASAAGSWDWVVAAALAGLLLLYNARYAESVRFLLKAYPIDSPVLSVRFQTLVEKCGIPTPRFERVPLDGGALANALALPSLRGSSVLFSDALLERLDTDETVAICAHELAHLEHFNATFLRRINIENIALIVSAALVPVVGRLAGLTSSLLPEGLWLIGFAVVLVRRAKDRQRNETASDLRAIQLCGDAEALVRALSRLYSMARLPRRFDQQQERQATHPSLARRIRDIRAAAGIAAGGLDATSTFTASDGQTSVTFEDERLNWCESEAVTHTLKYTGLAELRVHARGRRPSTLVAVERGGRRWEMPLAQNDVARVQAVLDVVDGRLPEPVAPPSVWPKIGRAFMLLAAMIGVASGQLAMALVALLAIVQPAAPLMAAAGIASMAAAGVLLRQSGFDGGAYTELALMLGGFGSVLLVVARTKRSDPLTTRAVLCVAALGVFAALALARFLIGGTDPIRLHQSGQSVTAAPVLLLALAGALTLWRSRTARHAAIPVLLLAGATTVVASTTFLDRFGEDIFIAPAPALSWMHPMGSVVTEFRVPVTGESLRLSARGRLVAIVETHYDDDDDVETTFHIGRAGQRLVPVNADDFTFMDEEHLLLTRKAGEGMEVIEAKAHAPDRPTWRVQVPDINDAQLSFDSIARRWRLIGWNDDRGVVTAGGVLGSSTVIRQEWTIPRPEHGWVKSLAASDDTVVMVQGRNRPGLLQRCGLWRFAWLVQPDSETHFRFTSATQDVADVSSRLDPVCFPDALPGGRLLCGAFDGTRTRFISLDPSSRQVSRIGWMDGRYLSTTRPNNGWISGWRNHTPVALNLERRLAVAVERTSADRVYALTGADDIIGTLSFDGAGSTIRLMRLSDAESSSARVAR